MSNFSLAATTGRPSEMPSGSEESVSEELVPVGAGPDSRQLQVLGLRGLALIHQTLQAHSDQSRQQMAELMGMAGSGIQAGAEGLERVTEALHRQTEVTARGLEATNRAIARSSQAVIDSVEALRADFNLGIGELIALQRHARLETAELLEAVRSPAETAGAELRRRGEHAYRQGWYLEAYEDLNAAIAQNRFDYFALRDLGNLALYHSDQVPLEAPALDIAAIRYAAAARYSEPSDTAYAAECVLYQAAVAALQQQWETARQLCTHARELNPRLTEALYQRASTAALSGDIDATVADLQAAILEDPGYWDRTIADADFLAHSDVAGAVAATLRSILDRERADYREAIEPLRSLSVPGGGETEAGRELSEILSTPESSLTSPALLRGIAARARTLEAHATEFQSTHAIRAPMHESIFGIASVAYSSDGKLLASAGWDASVRIWDAELGTSFCDLRLDTRLRPEEPCRIDALAFRSPEQIVAFTGADRILWSWSLPERRVIRAQRIESAIVDPQRRPTTAAFSADGSLLAASAPKNALALWNTDLGELARVMTGHSNHVSAVAFSPDNRLLASGDGVTRSAAGDAQYLLKLWSLESGECLWTSAENEGPVAAVAFSPCGSTLASSNLSGEIHLWDRSTGQRQETLRASTDIRTLAFSPDGRWLAGGGGREPRLWLWDRATGQVAQQFHHHLGSLYAVAFAPSGEQMATGGGDNRVVLYAWNLRSR